MVFNPGCKSHLRSFKEIKPLTSRLTPEYFLDFTGLEKEPRNWHFLSSSGDSMHLRVRTDEKLRQGCKIVAVRALEQVSGKNRRWKRNVSSRTGFSDDEIQIETRR